MSVSIDLTHIEYTQLDFATWCATAQVNGLSKAMNARDIWQKSHWWSISDTSTKTFTKLAHFNWHRFEASIPSSVRSIAHQQRQLQRQGVRQLLKELLNTIRVDDVLDESGFPYRLSHSQYYVCFSHTNAHKKTDTKLSQKTGSTLYSKVAVAISRYNPVGIDIESNAIAWHVAKRI